MNFDKTQGAASWRRIPETFVEKTHTVFISKLGGQDPSTVESLKIKHGLLDVIFSTHHHNAAILNGEDQNVGANF